MKRFVVCVYRSGGDFLPEDVTNLQAMVARNLKEPYEFMCLTNDPQIPSEIARPLWHSWPRWWPKLEMFRPGLFPPESRVLYLDLDTVILGSLEPFFLGPFVMLSDLMRNRMLASGVMAWEVGKEPDLYEQFRKDAARIMAEHPKRMDFWLNKVVGSRALRFQALLPAGMVVSYKRHCTHPARDVPDRVPDGARVVCFHGYPRPGDLDPSHELHRVWSGKV